MAKKTIEISTQRRAGVQTKWFLHYVQSFTKVYVHVKYELDLFCLRPPQRKVRTDTFEGMCDFCRLKKFPRCGNFLKSKFAKKRKYGKNKGFSRFFEIFEKFVIFGKFCYFCQKNYHDCGFRGSMFWSHSSVGKSK